MSQKLSILICSIPDRRIKFLYRLIGCLAMQLHEMEVMLPIEGLKMLPSMMEGSYKGRIVEILINDESGISIGTKRNKLLGDAKGDYIAFIDDDDLVSDDYFKNIFEGIEKGVDCCSLRGIITEDGQNPQIFEHSIKYHIYRTITDSEPGEVRYERYPNHLNAIKASIAKQFTFPEKNHGEDTDFATAIYQSGLIKTEHVIPTVIYNYEFRSKK